MNAFKTALAKRTLQIGLWQALANPYTAEICAGAGFDWLAIDAEHAPNDLPLVLAQLQTIAAFACEPVVRVPAGEPMLVKQYLDLGARSLIVPMVESGAHAEALVRATRYPPHGIRGVASAIVRASRWNRGVSYLQNASADIYLAPQIESRDGLAALPDILRVPGVDGIFIGPADLAASLGHLGNPAHPQVQSAIESAILATVSSGKAAGILMSDLKAVRRYIHLGATFVAVGTDVTILARGAETLVQAFRTEPESSAPLKPTVY